MHKICINCAELKPCSEFKKNNKTLDGYTRLCKRCINIMSKPQRKKHNTNCKHEWYIDHAQECKLNTRINTEKSPEAFISRLYWNVCKGKHSDDVHVDCYYLIDLYHKQNGLCAITGLPMKPRMGVSDAISVDRKDSNVGYVHGNIQLVCQFINLGKRTRTDAEVVDFITKIRKTGLLGGCSCYLAGAIEFEDAGRAVEWRSDLKSRLHTLSIKVFDPLCKPDWVPEAYKINPKAYADLLVDPSNDMSAEYWHAVKFMVDFCSRMAHSCDFMIINMPKVFTVGTLYEVKIATDSQKPLFIVNPNKYPATWLLGLFEPNEYDNIFFDSFDSLWEHIKDIDSSKVELDPLKWNFISCFKDGLFKSAKWRKKKR